MSDEIFFSFVIGNGHTFLNLSGSSKDPGLCFKREGIKKKKGSMNLFFQIHSHLERVSQQEIFFKWAF